MKLVKLIGLDYGTTTSSAVIASAQLLRNSVTGRTELSQLRELFRSEIVFTPISGDRIDEPRIAAYIDTWLAAGLTPDDTLFGGGALLTGLTAQKENAAALIQLIRSRIGDAVIASAGDPRLEAWLAFMGGCVALSREHPTDHFINLDIGGGTTNLAWGLNGEVLSTGCLFIGARHIEVVPGSYRIVNLSWYAMQLLQHLGIHKGIGDELSRRDVDAIVNQYIQWLSAAVNGEALDEPTARQHTQVPFCIRPHEQQNKPIVTLSGGVGELVYSAIRGEPLPRTTAFGDLGIDLAERLLLSSPWRSDFLSFAPAGGGRATSFGLLRHNTQVSGNTVFLPDPTMLPLRDLPIFGMIDVSLPESQWATILELIQNSPIGGCVQIRATDLDAEAVQTLGMKIAASLRAANFPPGHPLVIIIAGNVGKALGHYVTDWGRLPLALMVIDEITLRDAQFIHIGRPQQQVIPVSFYGLQA